METKADYEAGGQRVAEDANYWQTTVHPAKSQAEIPSAGSFFGSLLGFGGSRAKRERDKEDKKRQR